MSRAVKTLNVKIQRSNYISFFAGDVTVMSSTLTFGELSMHPEQGDNINLSPNANTESVKRAAGEGNENKDFLTDEESSDENDSADEELKTKHRVFPGLYEKGFAMSLFVPLVKLPGLTAQMEFYAPKLEQFPLKVNMHASSGLGEITVFVKDQKQIALDDQKKT